MCLCVSVCQCLHKVSATISGPPTTLGFWQFNAFNWLLSIPWLMGRHFLWRVGMAGQAVSRFVCVCVCVCSCAHVCAHVHVCVYVCMHVCILIIMHVDIASHARSMKQIAWSHTPSWMLAKTIVICQIHKRLYHQSFYYTHTTYLVPKDCTLRLDKSVSFAFTSIHSSSCCIL